MVILHLQLDYRGVDPWADTEWPIPLHPGYGSPEAAHGAVLAALRCDLALIVDAGGEFIEIHPDTVASFVVFEVD